MEAEARHSQAALNCKSKQRVEFFELIALNDLITTCLSDKKFVKALDCITKCSDKDKQSIS